MDAYTEIRAASAGNLTADETADFTIGAMVRPLYLHANVPSVSSGDTLVLKVEHKNGSTVLTTSFGASISAAGHYVLPFFCDDLNMTKITVTFDVTKNDTAAASFGAVEAWLSNSRIS